MSSTLALSYPAIAESVPLARKVLVDFAREAGIEDEQLENVRLAASEAITNVVRHAYGPGEQGSLQVEAAVAGDELWLLVSDEGHGLKDRSDNPGLGLGLALIASVADEFAVVRRALRGIELRMRFDLAARRQARGSVASATAAASSRFSTTK